MEADSEAASGLIIPLIACAGIGYTVLSEMKETVLELNHEMEDCSLRTS